MLFLQTTLCVMTVMQVPLEAGRALPEPTRCELVRVAVDRALTLGRATDLVPVAPYFEGASLPQLLSFARAAAEPEKLRAFLAFGLTRRAEALRMLRTEPSAAADRVGWSLALLALGDGTRTATLSAQLTRGLARDRHELVRALALLSEVRPRMLLTQALQDPEPAIRLTAAAALHRAGSEASVRVLRALAADTGIPEKLRVRATRTLEARDALDKEESWRSSRSSRLRAALVSVESSERSRAFARVASTGELSAATLRRLAQKAEKQLGPAVSAESTMALALLGDQEALQSMSALDDTAKPRALDVLLAFAVAAPEPLEASHADKLGSAVGAWLLAPSSPIEALSALESVAPLSALQVARRLIESPGARRLGPALEIMGRRGQLGDIEALLSLAASKRGRTRGLALRAAAKLCEGKGLSRGSL